MDGAAVENGTNGTTKLRDLSLEFADAGFESVAFGAPCHVGFELWQRDGFACHRAARPPMGDGSELAELGPKALDALAARRNLVFGVAETIVHPSQGSHGEHPNDSAPFSNRGAMLLNLALGCSLDDHMVRALDETLAPLENVNALGRQRRDPMPQLPRLGRPGRKLPPGRRDRRAARPPGAHRTVARAPIVVLATRN